MRRSKGLVSTVVNSHDLDFVILAECRIEIGELLHVLNAEEPYFERIPSSSGKIVILTRFDPAFVGWTDEGHNYSIRQLRLPARDEIILATAHLRSKLRNKTEDQVMACVRFAKKIAAAEKHLGHRRTIVVGDLNMNPFEHGVVGTEGFHAVMSRAISLRGSRTVEKIEYPFFYNPMWAHFGDREDGPAGTYYYDNASDINYFWNMFDQVLLRPELAKSFREKDLQILTKAGDTDLLKNGRPDTRVGSDHLPILFRVDF